MEKIMSDPPKIKEKLPFKKNKKNNVHYVDNSLFLEKITEHRSKVIAAKEAGTEKPRVPNYLGECFLKIANHLAYKSNFINYTYCNTWCDHTCTFKLNFGNYTLRFAL
jgi:hypothetical protein